LQCAEGLAPKQSNRQLRAAMKQRVRRSRFLLARRFVTRRPAVTVGRKNGCSKEQGLPATIVLLVQCRPDAVTTGQLSIPLRRTKRPINPRLDDAIAFSLERRSVARIKAV
jgi:hypothetical protein